MHTSFRIQLFLIPLCLLLCSTSALAVDTWTWETPLPQGHYVNGFWVASATDVFACTDGGTVLHYDGSNWTITQTPVDTPLEDIFGFSTTDIFAVGQDGVILHYNGSSWQSMSSPTSGNLSSLWGPSNDKLYAVGSGGILGYDGSNWSSMSSTSSMYDVWGSAWNDVWAVGASGSAYHYNGSGWSWSSITSTRLNGVWGSASDNYYAVGDSGKIYHYDGSSWTQETDTDIPVTYLWDVWGDGSGNVFVCTGSGSVCQLSGADWTDSFFTLSTLQAIGGLSGDNVYVGGSEGAIYKKDGASWTELSQNDYFYFNGLYGSSASDIYGAGEAIFNLTPYGSIFQSTGNGDWSRVFSSNSPYSSFSDIWVWSPSKIFAVGYSSTADSGLMASYNGSGWSEYAVGGTSGAGFNAVWGTSETNAYAVWNNSARGKVFQYTGLGWGEVSNVEGADFNDVWASGPSDVYAVGEDATGGLVHYYGGTSWSSSYLTGSGGESASLEAVWGTGPDDVWAGGHLTTGGESGALWHKDGSGWSLVSDALSIWISGIFGASSSDVFFFDDDSYHSEEILHWNGRALKSLDCPMGPEVQSVWGASTSRYWFANGSSIMRLDHEIANPNLVPARFLLFNQ